MLFTVPINTLLKDSITVYKLFTISRWSLRTVRLEASLRGKCPWASRTNDRSVCHLLVAFSIDTYDTQWKATSGAHFCASLRGNMTLTHRLKRSFCVPTDMEPACTHIGVRTCKLPHAPVCTQMHTRVHRHMHSHVH